MPGGADRVEDVEAALSRLLELLGHADPGECWRLVVQAALAVVTDADLALVVGCGAAHRRVLAAAGHGTEGWRGAELTVPAAVIDPVGRTRMNVVVPGLRLATSGSYRVVSALLAPVQMAGAEPAVLLVGRRRDRRGFTTLDMEPLSRLTRCVETGRRPGLRAVHG